MRVGNTTAAAAAPGANTDTQTLLDTFTALNRIGLGTHRIEKYVCNLAHNAAGTIDAAKSVDGTTWVIYFVSAVVAPTAPDLGTIIEIQTSGVDYLRVRWTNGGSAQTTWLPSQELVEGDRAAA